MFQTLFNIQFILFSIVFAIEVYAIYKAKIDRLKIFAFYTVIQLIILFVPFSTIGITLYYIYIISVSILVVVLIIAICTCVGFLQKFGDEFQRLAERMRANNQLQLDIPQVITEKPPTYEEATK